MSNELRFEFDQVTVAAVEKKLGAMRSQAPRALKNALNATAREARKDLALKARETYTVKFGGFNREMRLKNATTSNLVAELKMHGHPLEFKHFSIYGGKGGAKLSVRIKKSSGRKTIDRGFVNTISNKGQSKGHSGAAMWTGGSEKQPKRLHIEALYSVSVPQMIGNKTEVYGVVEPDIMTNLRKNVDNQVEKILRG